MLREIARAFEEVLGVALSDEQRTRVQERVIHEFGGERVYIPKRASFDLGQGPNLTGGLAATMQRYGVTARTVYIWRRRYRRGR